LSFHPIPIPFQGGGGGKTFKRKNKNTPFVFFVCPGGPGAHPRGGAGQGFFFPRGFVGGVGWGVFFCCQIPLYPVGGGGGEKKKPTPPQNNLFRGKPKKRRGVENMWGPFGRGCAFFHGHLVTPLGVGGDARKRPPPQKRPPPKNFGKMSFSGQTHTNPHLRVRCGLEGAGGGSGVGGGLPFHPE